MAIREVKELFAGRSGGLEEGLERRYTRKFRVRTTDKHDGPIEVTFAPGIPRLYEGYASYSTAEVDPWALCRRIDPQQDEDDWTTWTVTCEYDTRSPNGDGAGQPENPGQPGPGGGRGAAGNPELELPTVEWGVQTREVAVQRPLFIPVADHQKLVAAGLAVANDFDVGRRLTTSALQPFDPPPTVEKSFKTLTVERNEAKFPLTLSRQYEGAFNLDAFLTYAAGRWLCKSITGREVYKGPFRYARVRYEFWLQHQDDIGWQYIELLDAGTMRLGAGGVPVPIIPPIGGHPVSTPQLLKDGQPLTAAEIADPDIGPQFLRFFVRPYKPFAPLKINVVV